MRNLFGLILLVGMLSGCDDSFSTVIEIDSPTFEAQMTINSFVLSGDDNVRFYIGTNLGILEATQREDYYLSNATITITRSEDGVSYNSIDNGIEKVNSSLNYEMFDIDPLFFLPGKTYIFMVEHPDFPTSETSLTFPLRGELANLEYKFEDGIDEDGDKASSISFDIVDDNTTSRYYELEMRSNNGSFFLTSLDPASTDGDNFEAIFYDNSNFSGDSYTSKVRFDRWSYTPDSGEAIDVKWTSVNKDYYEYSKSIVKHRDAQDNPFSTPVPVYSNLQNAIGVIGLGVANEFEFTP